ncbi:MAG: TrmB family transcriptional regulator [bacterium]
MIHSTEEMISLFKGLGITEYEAKVYLSLLSSHPASAYTISQNSGVPHSRVYDVTRRLMTREMVASTGTKPEMFSPLSPEKVIEKLKHEYQHYASDLQEHLKEYEFHSDFDPVWNLTNKDEALQKTIYIIGQAEQRVFIGLWDQEYPELEEPLYNAYDRGVHVYMLIYGSMRPGFGVVYNHSIENMPRYDYLGRTLDCTADSSWCITGVMGNSSPCRVMWSQNRGLVLTIESYIKHDFYLAEIQKHLGDEIVELFGQNLHRLREKFLD